MDQRTIASIRASHPLAAYADGLSVPGGGSYLFNTPESMFSGAKTGTKSRAVAHVSKGLTGVDGQHSRKSRAMKFFSVRKDKRMDRTAMQRRKAEAREASGNNNENVSSEGGANSMPDGTAKIRHDAPTAAGAGAESAVFSHTGMSSGSGASFPSDMQDLASRINQAQSHRTQIGFNRNEIGTSRLTEYCARIESNEPALQLTGMRFLRERLIVPTNPPIREVMETGVVPRLIMFLTGKHLGGQVVNKPGQGYINPSYGYAALGESVIVEMNPRDSVIKFDAYLDAGVVDPTCMLSERMVATDIEAAEFAAWKAGEGAGQPNTTINTFVAHRKLFHLCQYEAAWCLSQIATNEADEAGQVLINNGTIPLVIDLIAYTPHEKVREACLLCIGNLTAFVDECRDIFLENNVTVALLWQLSLCKCPPHRENKSPSLSTMENVGWALDNLAKGEPAPLRKYTVMTIEALSYLIYCPVETTTLAGLNTVLTMVDNSCAVENVDLILESGIMNRVYELLKITEDLMPIWLIVQKYEMLGRPDNSHVQLSEPEKTTLQQRLQSLKTNTKMRVLALRVFCAALRSPIMMHKRILLNRQKFPFVWELMLWELGGDACLQTLVLGAAPLPAMSSRAGWQPNASYGYQSTRLHEKMKIDGERQTQKADILSTFFALVDSCDADEALYSQLGGCLPAAVHVDIDAAYLSRLLSGQFLDIALHQIDLHNSYMLDTHIAHTLFVMLRRSLQLPIFKDDSDSDATMAASHIHPNLLSVLQQQSFCGKSFLILMRILDHSTSGSGTGGVLGVYDSEFVSLILCAVESFIRWSIQSTSFGASTQNTCWVTGSPALVTAADYLRSDGSSILQQVLGDAESRRIVTQAVSVIQMAEMMPSEVVEAADRLEKAVEEVDQLWALKE